MFAKKVFVTALVVGLCLTASTAWASYAVFPGDVTGTWDTASLWDTGLVPNANTGCNINGAVTVSAVGTATCGGLNLQGGGGTLNGAVVVTGAGAVLEVHDAGVGYANAMGDDLTAILYCGFNEWGTDGIYVTNGGRLQVASGLSIAQSWQGNCAGGKLSVSAGGSVTADGMSMGIGGGTNILTVTGADSLASFSSKLIVGKAAAATGIVNLGDGGLLSVGNLLVGAGIADFNFGGGLIQIAGNVDVTGATFDFSQMGSLNLPSYTLLTYGGTFTGSPALTNVPAGYQVAYQPGSVVLAAVPEPSTLALLACGLLGLVAYAWRKRK